MPGMRYPRASGSWAVPGGACPSAAVVGAWCLFVGVLALLPGSCPSAQPYEPVQGDPLHEPWRWRTYLDVSGLDVQCMAESPDGTMWFGTANGLWSYDGIDWMRHDTDNSVGRIVTTLTIAADGTLFAGGDAGVGQFSDGQWTQLLRTPSDDRIIAVRDVPIRRLAIAPDGSLWGATNWGALHGSGSVWTLYTDPPTAAELRSDQRRHFANIENLPAAVVSRLQGGTPGTSSGDFTEISIDGQGRVWFGTTSGELVCHTPAPRRVGGPPGRGTWTVYNEADGLNPGAITSILPRPDGTLWILHAEADHADIFDGQNVRQLRLPLYQPALDLGDAGAKLLQTRDGVIWLAARYKLFAYRGDTWHTYEPPRFRFPSTRNVVLQTADGALWFSGPNAEIYRVDYQTPRWLTLYDLNFEWESPEGVQWFLHRDGRVVVNEAERWTSYGVEDGLMDMPVVLLGTRSGDVWVAGSHQGTAAMARFDGQHWRLVLHDDFSFTVDWRAVFESSDGSVWFGSFVDTDGPAKHRNGILQYRDGVWIHHQQRDGSSASNSVEDPATTLPASTSPDHPIEKFIVFGESRDGRIWAGRNILVYHDGERWERVELPSRLRRANIETILTTKEGDLWIGTRELGALRYDGTHWDRFQGKESLMANVVRDFAQTTDGSIWAATDRGSSRFDGRAWMADVLPEELNIAHESGNLRASPSGALWINHYTLDWMRRAWPKAPPPAPDAPFRTVRFHFQGPPPRTSITTKADIISQPGNLAVLWSGVVPWRDPKDARLQFSYRLNHGDWSAFTSDRGHAFFTLPPGRHHLEVRARDADFNVDLTPATLDFTVLPPVWRQVWFIGLMVLLGGLVLAQSVRVLREQQRLRRARDELEIRVRERTAELVVANRELEAFSYSVSHDLRAPLRSLDGFSRILQEDCSQKLSAEENRYLQSIRAAAQRMGHLIDDMLLLARVARVEQRFAPVNLSALVEEIVCELVQQDSQRNVRFTVAPNVTVNGDANLLRIALENLVGNAWKFTSKRADAAIEFGVTGPASEPVYFVRDNGAGFDMGFVNKLFQAFQRLHIAADFPGSGIGLAIVHRVFQRHGGRVWAEAAVDQGATFYFTLGKLSPS
jgi:signal transduction histidine kinase